MRLAGEVVIVTGAAQGIGAVIADVLEEEGARVARTDVTGADVRLDVRDAASIEAAVAEVAQRLGQPSVLVNNAGVNRIAPAEELELGAWQDVLDVNLSGAFRCSQIAGRAMLASGRGSIVNVASVLAFTGAPGRVAYCAAKSGLLGLTRVLALEWAPRGVRVNAVCPGYTRTAMVEQAVRAGLLSEGEILSRTPTGRLVEPAEIGRAVAYLASTDASSVTGQTLVVDGGLLSFGGLPTALDANTV